MPERGAAPGAACATPECVGVARWIPFSHVRTKPQPFAYYCTACCDEIGQAAELAAG